MRDTVRRARATPAPQAKPSIEQARQYAREFIEAMNTVLLTSPTLPPVRGLQAGLLPAWRAWARAIEQAGYLESLQLQDRKDYGPREASDACSELIFQALSVNKVENMRELSGARIHAMSMLAGFAGLYLVRSHAVIEPTDALQLWLSRTDIGQDVPASLFRVPLGAVFLRVDERVRQIIDPPLAAVYGYPTETQGIYIFEAWVEGRRELMFTAVGDSNTETDFGRGVRIGIEDENESLLSAVRRIQPTHGCDTENFVPLVDWCLKVMLYLQTPNAVRIEEMRDNEATTRLTRVGSKKASRIERKLASRYNRIILGPAQIPGHAGGEVSPHWRRGHMRMQAHGPQMSLRKLIFIAPTLIRADRLNDAGAVAH